MASVKGAFAGATIAVAAALASSAAVSAPVTWTVALGGQGQRYDVIFDETRGWNDAKAAAEALGGHLVTITSPGEQTFIRDTLFCGSSAATCESSLGLTGSYWIGLSDAASEGTFQWVTGEPYGAFTHWGVGQPDNNGGFAAQYGGSSEVGEDWVQFVWRGDTNTTTPYAGRWNDAIETGYSAAASTFPHLKLRGYIVEYAPVPLPAALPLFVGALALLAGVRTRRRRSPAGH